MHKHHLVILKKARICLDDLKSFDVYSNKGLEVGYAAKDIDSIAQILSNVSEIKGEKQASDPTSTKSVL